MGFCGEYALMVNAASEGSINACVITLRRGKEIKGRDKEVEEKIVVYEPATEAEPELEPEPSTSREKPNKSPPPPLYEPAPPFSEALQDTQKKECDRDIYETLRKCEVNIPLLVALKQNPRYAKFLKEMCTTKRNRRLRGTQKVKVSEHGSVMFQKALPPNCSDPGMLAIPCVIGNTTFPRAMLDLGDAINVIPYSLFESLKLGTLHETSVVIQLADRSNAYPKGRVEDVLVKVNKLIFFADFYVFDMEPDKHATHILLGRSFLKTARIKVDVHSGCLTMEFDGSLVEFNIYDSMKFQSDDHSCYSIDVIDSYSRDVFEIGGEDSLQGALEHSLEGSDVQYVLNANLQETVQALEEHAPIVELKSLPEHLKYAFLGNGDTLPVIISSKLSEEQERKLIEVLKEHKEAIRWTIADIMGISPTTCMQRILLEDDAKPVRQPQSKWVIPTQVVPKKSRVTVMENQHGVLVPTRVQNGWLVCIDYRRLNAVAIVPEDQEKTTFTCPFSTFLQKDVDFVMDEACKKAFEDLKGKLVSSPIIQPPDWSLPFEIMYDASDYVVGAVLGQRVGRVLHAIYYASMTLNEAQRNYSTTEKESLVVVFSLEKFRSYFLGTKVIVFTDHVPSAI
ncbi:uncharacterized protein LOC104897300 [Beta vulgaris subsp. vulgaris]|uniref:uncharacterized protein LOC104897300 n=1 Tax=Beta vulgaris subsp. vulgaris TaxID=3555 RepID=UPI002036A57B|nr:uncharacterized protein LOC104897300 [Beta vulgaris subsp. vulgaris]